LLFGKLIANDVKLLTPDAAQAPGKAEVNNLAEARMSWKVN